MTPVQARRVTLDESIRFFFSPPSTSKTVSGDVDEEVAATPMQCKACGGEMQPEIELGDVVYQCARCGSKTSR
jgi:hypothetical protein